MGQRPNYGIDAPAVMGGLLIGGGIVATAGWFTASHYSGLLSATAVIVALLATVAAFFGLLMLIYWLVGKSRTRALILNSVPWTGSEHVLDVGTGAGFLMAGAAKRVPQGHVVGLDAWSVADLSNNRPGVTRRNLELEGIAERCSILTGDARNLTYADGSFDRVLSLLCLHNIEPVADRMRACSEIARVLKPSGFAVIGDYVPTHTYAKAFSEAGLRVHQSRAAFGTALSLMWVLVAQKAAS